MSSLLLPSFAVAVLFALIHLFIYKIKVFAILPRTRFLSLGGGIAAAYVFMHLLPELFQRMNDLEGFFGNLPVDNHQGVFFVALLGLTSFYGLEKFSITKHIMNPRGEEKNKNWSAGVYWSHLFIFAFYNWIIGILLHERETQNWSSLAATAFALGAHFFVTDHALLENHRKDFLKSGRWVLAAAMLSGWLIGFKTPPPTHWISLLFSFLIGGIIMNVIKEELPQEKNSHFGSFMAGVLFYSLILFLA